MSLGLTRRHTLSGGAVRYLDLAYLVSQDDAVPARIAHSHFHEVDGGVLAFIDTMHWPTASLAITWHPLPQMIALSPFGEVFLFGSQSKREERIQCAEGDPRERGPLRQVRHVGQRTFAVGMGRQVYRRDDADGWTCLDTTIRPAVGETKGFEAVDGFSETDLYAVGWDGEIWQWDGEQWTMCPSPTDEVLTSVACAGDGQVYAAGRQGLLVAGRRDEWACIAPSGSGCDIWDLAWCGGQLHLATAQGLRVLRDGRLVPADTGDIAPFDVQRLSAADGVLWCFGAKTIVAFDGTGWTRVD